MKVIAIIQARMGSTRFPGKILKPLGKLDVLSYVTSRCKKIIGIDEVIVATSTLSQDDAIVEWCNLHNINYFRGSEDDVLKRYIECAKNYDPDYIMRITSDCPFVDFEMGTEMIQQLKENQVDIIDLKGELPRGLAVELISYKALQYIHENGHENRHREHVTYYAYEFKDEFTRFDYEIPSNRRHPELRITLDTKADYTLLQTVAEHFGDIYVSSDKVIHYLLTHPEIASINAHIEQKPVI
ncbi:8-amino-3,8-dideoxy-manno-octulosonate cytidylyltransferase [Ureibacillus acetophenoni]